MSSNNINKTKDENIDNMLKKILNIKDSNISFSKNAVSKERIKGRMATVYTGTLTYESTCCEFCQSPCVNRHSFKESWIQLVPYQEVPTYLHLYKQRFYCKNCHRTFSAKTYYVAKNCYLSQSLKFAIAVDLKKKLSMKDIASRYFVSSKTIERVLDSFFKEPCHNLNYLPKHLLIDEFKGTTDCEGAMCFIISDADSGKIFDILDDRRNYKLERYFMRFSFKARRKVSHIVMDMNAAYGVVTKRVFPHARISIDPMADKMLVMSAFIMLVGVDQAPAWVVTIIVCREIAITGLRTILVEQGEVMAAAKAGKLKTVTQMISIILLLLHDWPFQFLPFSLGEVFLYLALIATVYSGYEYFKHSWSVFSRSM